MSDGKPSLAAPELRVPVTIGEFTDQPIVIEGHVESDVLDLQRPALLSNEPLQYRLNAYLAGTEALLRGRLELVCEFECVRCLTPFDETLIEPDFIRSFALEESPAVVDIRDDLREDILLTFPSFPQCSPTCKGLCPVCAINLNTSTCDCTTDIVDPRWGGLDKLDLGSLETNAGNEKT